MSASDDGLRTGWGGDSIRGRIGTEAKVTELVRAWWDSGKTWEAWVAIAAHLGEEPDRDAANHEGDGEHLVLAISTAALNALEARE